MRIKLTVGFFFNSLFIFQMAFRPFSGLSGSPTTLDVAPNARNAGGFSVGANLRTSVSPWVRFTWKINSISEIFNAESSSDLIRPAAKDESDKVLDVIMHSLSMDSAWNDSMMKVDQYLRDAVSRIFDQEEPLCLVIAKGNRFIAASLLDAAADVPSQLLSGPVVLVEYRNRGIGSRLLHASLLALKDRGLTSICGVTRINTIASRYVYPKFGGVAESIQLPATIATSLEAKA